MWRKVQVERPRTSTSGGQSVGGVVGGVGWGTVVGVVWALVMAAFHMAEEVQVRHLGYSQLIPDDFGSFERT